MPSHYQDGFCGGSELPQDLELDRMIYPERPAEPELMLWEPGQTLEQWQTRNKQMEEARESAHAIEDRAFVLTLSNVTGVHTGPPRTVK